MSEMSVKEAYKVLQVKYGIEVGDKVKILRSWHKDELGFDGVLHSERASAIGKVGVVDFPHDGHISVSGFEHNPSLYIHTPFFALELIEKAKPELPPIVVGGERVEFEGNLIRIGGITVSKTILLRILERLEN